MWQVNPLEMCWVEKSDLKDLRKFCLQEMSHKMLESVEQEERQCDEVETVREVTYFGDRVSAGGGCEAAVTARTRCGWVKLRECGELRYGRRLTPKQKGCLQELCKSSTSLLVKHGA